jgi:hypothetical protein
MLIAIAGILLLRASRFAKAAPQGQLIDKASTLFHVILMLTAYDRFFAITLVPRLLMDSLQKPA